jgi:Cytochrome c554 and c-prime
MRAIQWAMVAAILGLAPAVAAQQIMGRCATCHFANATSVPGASHLSEWAASPHARASVGCESCHGGDPTSVVPSDAHRGVDSPRLPWSRVAPANLPATCGACHQAERAAFRRSPHDEPLMRGTANAPTCSTCHGAMTARVPAPAALEVRCASCHGPQSSGATYPARARTLIASLNAIEDDLAQARWMLTRGAGDARARALSADVDARLAEAAEAWHTFDLEEAERRAQAARAAVDALLGAVGAAPSLPAPR